ncbi:cytochrome oxidase small assembly protein [Nitrogeniibacter aestuarii]|nr:cytochrome oxidase small assembly protein [Nitrogeniibacter aestuarii]
MTNRQGNRRTGLILLSIVLVFFVGIMVKTALLGR